MNVELIINGNGYLLTYTLPSGNMVEVRCATPQQAVEYITDLEYREDKKARQNQPSRRRRGNDGHKVWRKWYHIPP